MDNWIIDIEQGFIVALLYGKFYSSKKEAVFPSALFLSFLFLFHPHFFSVKK